MAVCAITGSSGLLGKYLLATQPMQPLQDQGSAAPLHEIITCYRNNQGFAGYSSNIAKLDVSNFMETIDVLFKMQPDIIIHCAANGDVDNVEANSSEAVRSDLLGVIHLKDFAEKMNCKLVIISSNAVFDGNHSPYAEYSKKNPINIYGKIKSLADDIIEKSNCKWMIIRPILLYGWPYPTGRQNWATKIIKALKDDKELKLVDDSFSQPTYAKDVAKAIWYLIKEEKWNETFHVATNKRVSIYDFGKTVAEVFELDQTKIKPALLSDFKSIAPRPIDTCFNVDKLNAAGFSLSGITEGLKKMREEK